MASNRKAKRVVEGTIVPQKNEFHDHFLDVVGAEFKADHSKGLAEWIKNSADAYLVTAAVSDADQYILLRFKQGNPKRDSIFECIDFVGMTKENIDNAAKVWGKPDAASKGRNVATFGGHGNGGKFYMRQMFKQSKFITFRRGLLNVFGFNAQSKYGFASGYEDRPMTLQQAMEYAHIDLLDIPAAVKTRWKKKPNEAGFTVVRGEQPERFAGKATIQGYLDDLRLHPQARRLLAHKQVICLSYADKWGTRLVPPEVSPRPGFEDPRIIPLPKRYSHNGEVFEFRTKQYRDGCLILKTSEQPMSRTTGLAALNSIDILGEVGCIGSYRLFELGRLSYGSEAEFVYGELSMPLLEDPALGAVLNDRHKLADTHLTQAVLAWVREQVDALAKDMSEKRREEQRSRDLRQSSLFNQVLDRWKNSFMTKLTGELFGGSGIGSTFGGSGGNRGGGGGGNGGGDDGTGGGCGTAGDGQGGGENENPGGGSGDKSRKGPKFPRVLLSSHDIDPLSESGAKLDCDPRHPPVYQRADDIPAGIYWINTSRVFANKVMTKHGADSQQFREYLFQRYVDIILKQSIYEVAKRETQINPERVDQIIDKVTSDVQDAAATDLESFLFEETLTGSAAVASGVASNGGASDDAGSAEEEEVPSMGEMLAGIPNKERSKSSAK